MDRCIYVDTGPLILWQMRGLDMYNRYVQIYFPIQKKKKNEVVNHDKLAMWVGMALEGFCCSLLTTAHCPL